MELVSTYIYNRVPVEVNNINVITHHRLKREGWYNDNRVTKKFSMFNKRIEVDGKWYRAMLRFEYTGENDSGNLLYKLSWPCPFVITECEPITTSASEQRWKDNKTFHGPNLGMTGYLQQGVPAAVLDEVNNDIKACVEYN